MRFTRYTTCAIALAAALSMPALAQGTGSNTSPQATGAATTASDNFTRRDNDGGFQWSWLGLLGLVGLMGLRKQPDVNRLDTTRASVSR